MYVIKVLVIRFMKRKPSEETEDETPLTIKRIGLLKPYFRAINCRQFVVLTTASLLINSKILKWFLLWADYLLIKYFPGFNKLGRVVVIELRQPIKTAVSIPR